MPLVKKHILLLSFPHFGHLIPLLELAKQISKYHHVTFAISEIRLEDIKKRELFIEDPNCDLQFISTNDGYAKEHDGPGGMEKTMKEVIPAIGRFLEEITGGGNESYTTTSGSRLAPVDAVIADAFLIVPASVCFKHGKPLYLFNTASAGFLTRCLTIDEGGWGTGALPKGIHALFLEIKNGLPKVQGIVINSFREIETDVLSQIAKFPGMASLTTYCVGPLLTEEKEGTTTHFKVENQVKDWLDSKGERSVIYISFGTVGIPGGEQLHEIGKALLSLKQPFIFSLQASHQQHLPGEILDRIGEQLQGLKSQFLVLPWLPQKVILAHPATEVFLSHCGWNSTLESLLSGVPVVAWPMFGDQETNAEWLVNHGIGLKIPGTARIMPGGGGNQRTVPADEIQKAIANVGGWNDGQSVTNKYRDAAQNWGEKVKAAIAPNGSSQNELRELVKFDRK